MIKKLIHLLDFTFTIKYDFIMCSLMGIAMVFRFTGVGNDLVVWLLVCPTFLCVVRFILLAYSEFKDCQNKNKSQENRSKEYNK